MRARIVAASAAVLTVGLVIAGCGSSSTTTSTGATGATGASGVQGAALSKTEFLKQGNAICDAGNKTTNAAAKAIFTNKKPSDAQVQQFADTVVPAIQAQIDGIRALPAPSGDEAQVSAIIDAAQKATDEVKADPSKLAGGKAFAEANKLTKDYGLTSCGGG